MKHTSMKQTSLKHTSVTRTSVQKIFFLTFVLVACGADSFCVSRLHYAAEIGSVEIVQEFCDTDLNEVDDHGRTPLHYAVINRHVEVARFLLRQQLIKADVKDELGYTPLFYAKSSGDTALINLFSV